MFNRLQFKRGLESNIPSLFPAEIAMTTDKKNVYIGSDIGNVRLLNEFDKDVLSKEKTLISSLAIDLKVGDFLQTHGFYSVNDFGAGLWSVQRQKGNEVWNITGYGFDVSDDCEIRYGDKKLVFLGDTISTKQMGCKADGKSDDSVILKTLMACGKFRKVIISEGNHIINVTKGTDQSPRYFCRAKVPHVQGTKGKSIIKLGKENCDGRKFTNFTALFDYQGGSLGGNFDLHWEGVTFDYNPSQNPLYHFGNRFVSLENNVRQSAIHCMATRDFSLKYCTFIGHSGANTVHYTSRKNDDRGGIVEIAYNKFLDIGAESGVGIHDHSSLAVHSYAQTPAESRGHAHIHDNVFIAHKDVATGTYNAPNAYNAYEGSIYNTEFKHNYAEGYFSGFMPCSRTENSIGFFNDNICKNVTKGFQIWTFIKDELGRNDETKNGFNYLEIKNNEVKLNISYFINTPNFNINVKTDDAYKHSCTGIVNNVTQTNAGTYVIDGNNIEFEQSDIFSSFPTNRNLNGVAFNILEDKYVEERTTPPSIESLSVTNNKISNSPHASIVYRTYPITKRILVKGNDLKNTNVIHTDNEVGASSIYVGIMPKSTFEANHIKVDISDNIIDGTNNTKGIMLNIQALSNSNYLHERSEIISNNSIKVSNSLIYMIHCEGLSGKSYTKVYHSTDGNIKRFTTDNTAYNINSLLKTLPSSNIGRIAFPDGNWENGKWFIYTNEIESIPTLSYSPMSIVHRNTPVPGEYMGWVYTNENTWKGFGLIEL